MQTDRTNGRAFWVLDVQASEATVAALAKSLPGLIASHLVGLDPSAKCLASGPLHSWTDPPVPKKTPSAVALETLQQPITWLSDFWNGDFAKSKPKVISGATRFLSACKRMDLRFVGDLLQASRERLAGQNNFGATSLQRLEELLASKGLALEMQIPAEVLAAYGDWKNAAVN